ncbi:IS110 family transposase [Paenibacillus sp. FSL R5-0912]|nr:IS110 family transposase [Paenibacillus sp. FSL R5-0912]AIQ42230.1 transposase [Paenibacillus sp. FSL R5-0912]AIQ43329.1 transposase [Paenibacillus sp. FSL R5-0912]
MKNTIKYVGLDVSKEKIAVAIADEGRDPARYHGAIAHTPDAVGRLIRKLKSPEVTLEVCYEAGPTGYDLYRWLTKMGISCTVIAPSRIPQRSGDAIKTDRRDAERLAQLHRAGELTAIHVPTPELEALRDLIRARENAREELHRARQHLVHFLLRHQIHTPEGMKKRWTKRYRLWLSTLTFEHTAQERVFTEMQQQLREVEERIKRLEEAMRKEAEICPYASVIQALQGLRGIALLTAMTLVVEIGNFERFRSPAQLMSYLGLVPRESSTGPKTRRGRLTKTGNASVRRALVESAWSYRYLPAVKGDLEKRLEGQSAHVQETSWKAQERLHKKYVQMVKRGKHRNLVIAAVGRELVGFIWCVAVKAEAGIA